METIRNYLDNIFASLPKTDKVLAVKAELRANMEDKYNELKAEGASESEAISQVISEFGNIDELLESMEVHQNERTEETAESSYLFTSDESDAYLKASHLQTLFIALGVALCIMAPAVIVILEGIASGNTVLEGLVVVPFFIIIAAGVGSIIYGTSWLKSFRWMKSTTLVLEEGLEENLLRQMREVEQFYTPTIVIAVLLCILSPLPCIIAEAIAPNSEMIMNLSAAILLFMVAIAVFLFIYANGFKSCYKTLLKRENYHFAKGSGSRLEKQISALFWPLVFCIYFIWSALFGAWGISWVIWPISGVAFGALKSFFRASR